jgi:biotin carboxyl carrier protein
MAEDTKPELQSFTLFEREYKTLYTKKFANRKKYEANDPKKVLSFIPGTIQDIFVKQGQKVKKGEPMLILESMKMMNKVLVPIDGTVKHINVTKGEKIPKEHLMIEFE